MEANDLLALLDGLSAVLFVVGPNDEVQDYHAARTSLLYAEPSVFLGRRLDERLPEPTARLVSAAVTRTRATEEAGTVEYTLPLPDGERHFEAHLAPLGGGRVGALCADITARRVAEQALRESEERFRLAFRTSPDAIAINRARDGRYVAANEGFSRILDWSEAEILGRTSVELGIWAVPEEREYLVAELGRTGKAAFEGHFRRRNGESVLGAMSATLFRIDGEQHILSVTRDVTHERAAEADRARLEEALRQSQKLEAVGRLAGGIAHDFNNLLTGILGYAEFLEAGIESGDPSFEDLAEIRTAAERARDLTAQLLAFARRQVVSPRVVVLNAIVRESERLLRRILGEDIDLAVHAAAELWPVRADSNQLQQVLLNLAVNARDAMPQGGRLTIETANVELDEHYAASHEGVTPGAYVLLAVSDSGVGMTEEQREHAFEPFYTTKLAGRGTGLGLATVYGIVRQSGGTIGIYSELGRGSTFRVYLPRTTDAPEAESPCALGPAPRGSETILLVEDEASVRELARRALDEAGYRVLTAAGGREALALASRTPEMIHLLLTDVVMPDLSGKAVAEALVPARPGLRVLYVSGYTQNAIVHHGVLDSGVQFLGKPYTPTSLCRKVREVLDQ